MDAIERDTVLDDLIEPVLEIVAVADFYVTDKWSEELRNLIAAAMAVKNKYGFVVE